MRSTDIRVIGTRPIKYCLWGRHDDTWFGIMHAMYDRQMASMPSTDALVPTSSSSTTVAISTTTTGSDSKSIAACSGSNGSSSSNDGIIIPRIIHQIWLGGACPTKYDEWRRTWHTHHPESSGWVHMFHGDNELEQKFPYSRGGSHEQHLRALMANATAHVERADIFRLDILLHFGGLYVDTDFECVQNMQLLHTQPMVQFYAGVSNTGTVELNNG
jgi:hypothetical protein